MHGLPFGSVVGGFLGASVALVAVAARDGWVEPEVDAPDAPELAVYELRSASVDQAAHQLRTLFQEQPGFAVARDEDAGRLLVTAPRSTQLLVAQALPWLDQRDDRQRCGR